MHIEHARAPWLSVFIMLTGVPSQDKVANQIFKLTVSVLSRQFSNHQLLLFVTIWFKKNRAQRNCDEAKNKVGTELANHRHHLN